MNVRLLLTAGALSLGLATGTLAQGMQMQAQPGMDDDQMSDDAGQAQRPVKRSNKRMKKPMQGKAMNRSQERMEADPDDDADDGM